MCQLALKLMRDAKEFGYYHDFVEHNKRWIESRTYHRDYRCSVEIYLVIHVDNSVDNTRPKFIGG